MKNGSGEKSNVIDLASRRPTMRLAVTPPPIDRPLGRADVKKIDKYRRVKSQREAWELHKQAMALDDAPETLDRAIELYSRAALLDPLSADTLTNLGRCHFNKGNKSAAVSFFCRAIEVNETCAVAHYNLGYVYFEDEEYEEAVPHFIRAIRIDKKLEDAHFDLALCYESTGRRALAIPEWRAYLKLMADPKPEDQKYVELAKKYLEGT